MTSKKVRRLVFNFFFTRTEGFISMCMFFLIVALPFLFSLNPMKVVVHVKQEEFLKILGFLGLSVNIFRKAWLTSKRSLKT